MSRLFNACINVCAGIAKAGQTEKLIATSKILSKIFGKVYDDYQDARKIFAKSKMYHLTRYFLIALR